MYSFSEPAIFFSPKLKKNLVLIYEKKFLMAENDIFWKILLHTYKTTLTSLRKFFSPKFRWVSSQIQNKVTKEKCLQKWHISPKNSWGQNYAVLITQQVFIATCPKKFSQQVGHILLRVQNPKGSFFSIEKIVNSLSLLLGTLRIQFYNPTTAAFPLTLANCISAEVLWILAQSQNIVRKILFVFTTSFYLRKLPRDGRIIFQQTRRILCQQNSENVQSFFLHKNSIS